MGFASDGGAPFGAPIVDSAGNLYGTTTLGGKGDCGIVYRLSPAAGGKYHETVLHSFNRFAKRNDDGCGPESYLVPDAAGNLYGTTNTGGGGVSNIFCDNGCGSVFKLAMNGDGTYTESVIHSFPERKAIRMAGIRSEDWFLIARAISGDPRREVVASVTALSLN